MKTIHIFCQQWHEKGKEQQKKKRRTITLKKKQQKNKYINKYETKDRKHKQTCVLKAAFDVFITNL